jgi:4-hydroxybenzoate polyprenyltransferase
MPDLASVIELLRAPAALTVPGDTLAGAAAAGWPFGGATFGLAASSVCLYWAGMALNDYADRVIDLRERPHRPIPSGRVRPGFALGLASGLTAAGIGAAALSGGSRALAVALPLAASVWAYDLALKNTAAGPAAMAAARTLDVLLGAGAGRLRAATPAALTVGAHTLAVTALSRHEVSGAQRRAPVAALAGTGGVCVAAGLALRGAARGTPVRRLSAGGLLAGYAATVGRAQIDAVRDPAPARVQRAVGAGILGTMLLQAGLAAGSGALRGAMTVASAFPLARQLARRVSPT